MELDVSKFIPESLLKFGRGWTEFKNVFQSIVNYFISKIESIKYLYNPVHTDIPLEIGDTVGLYSNELYTDREIREKLSRSTYVNKNLGNFYISIKEEIDKQFNIDSSLYNGTIIFDQFYIDGSKIESEALIETINLTENLKIKGEVYIDITRQFTQDEISKLYFIVKDILPIYFDIYFGYESANSIPDFTIENSLIDGISKIEFSINVQSFKTLLIV